MLTIRTTDSHWSLPTSATKREEWRLANDERAQAVWFGDKVAIVWDRPTRSHMVEVEMGPNLPKESVIRVMESMAP